MDTADITEFDMVSIGNNASLNKDCGPQTHLFEDRVMKIGSVSIGANCTIGAGSIILYNSVIENNTTIGSLSLVMKAEHLPANAYWQGIPIQKNIKI
jgi:non-ribosomal peptide synthetase-like protein